MCVNVLTATVHDLVRGLETGAWSSKSLAATYLNQIQAHNGWLHAVLQVADRDGILQQAEVLDEKRKNGELYGSLHGIPVIIKVSSFRRTHEAPHCSPN